MSHPEKAASDRGLFFCGLAFGLALLNRFIRWHEAEGEPPDRQCSGNLARR